MINRVVQDKENSIIVNSIIVSLFYGSVYRICVKVNTSHVCRVLWVYIYAVKVALGISDIGTTGSWLFPLFPCRPSCLELDLVTDPSAQVGVVLYDLSFPLM